MGSVVALPLEMRVGSQILAAVLGGPGVFYLWRSFYAPEDALRAVIFLGAAGAISFMLFRETSEHHRPSVLRRLLVRIGVRKNRD